MHILHSKVLNSAAADSSVLQRVNVVVNVARLTEPSISAMTIQSAPKLNDTNVCHQSLSAGACDSQNVVNNSEIISRTSKDSADVGVLIKESMEVATETEDFLLLRSTTLVEKGIQSDVEIMPTVKIASTDIGIQVNPNDFEIVSMSSMPIAGRRCEIGIQATGCDMSTPLSLTMASFHEGCSYCPTIFSAACTQTLPLNQLHLCGFQQNELGHMSYVEGPYCRKNRELPMQCYSHAMANFPSAVPPTTGIATPFGFLPVSSLHGGYHTDQNDVAQTLTVSSCLQNPVTHAFMTSCGLPATDSTVNERTSPVLPELSVSSLLPNVLPSSLNSTSIINQNNSECTSHSPQTSSHFPPTPSPSTSNTADNVAECSLADLSLDLGLLSTSSLSIGSGSIVQPPIIGINTILSCDPFASQLHQSSTRLVNDTSVMRNISGSLLPATLSSHDLQTVQYSPLDVRPIAAEENGSPLDSSTVQSKCFVEIASISSPTKRRSARHLSSEQPPLSRVSLGATKMFDNDISGLMSSLPVPHHSSSTISLPTVNVSRSSSDAVSLVHTEMSFTKPQQSSACSAKSVGHNACNLNTNVTSFSQLNMKISLPLLSSTFASSSGLPAARNNPYEPFVSSINAVDHHLTAQRNADSSFGHSKSSSWSARETSRQDDSHDAHGGEQLGSIHNYSAPHFSADSDVDRSFTNMHCTAESGAMENCSHIVNSFRLSRSNLSFSSDNQESEFSKSLNDRSLREAPKQAKIDDVAGHFSVPLNRKTPGTEKIAVGDEPEICVINDSDKDIIVIDEEEAEAGDVGWEGLQNCENQGSKLLRARSTGRRGRRRKHQAPLKSFKTDNNSELELIGNATAAEVDASITFRVRRGRPSRLSLQRRSDQRHLSVAAARSDLNSADVSSCDLNNGFISSDNNSFVTTNEASISLNQSCSIKQIEERVGIINPANGSMTGVERLHHPSTGSVADAKNYLCVSPCPLDITLESVTSSSDPLNSEYDPLPSQRKKRRRLEDDMGYSRPKKKKRRNSGFMLKDDVVSDFTEDRY